MTLHVPATVGRGQGRGCGIITLVCGLFRKQSRQSPTQDCVSVTCQWAWLSPPACSDPVDLLRLACRLEGSGLCPENKRNGADLFGDGTHR